MKKVHIDELQVGVPLSATLMSEQRDLLLAKGLSLTPEMMLSLRKSGARQFILGDPQDAKASTASIDEYRDQADAMHSALMLALDDSLTSADLDPEPDGEPLSASIRDTVQLDQWEARTPEFTAERAAGAAAVEAVCTGDLMGADVAPETMRVVDTLVQRFTEDPALAANLLNLRGQGTYLYEHSVNRAMLTIQIATAMQYARQQIVEVAVAALLADIGMASVSDEILELPRRLTPAEFVDVQKHIPRGLQAVSEMPGLPYVTRFIIYQHHERADGSGYPRKRHDRLIHKFASLVTVADIYDALISNRPWRQALRPHRAIEHLVREAGAQHVAPDAVRGLLYYLSLYPIGSLVRLSTGALAQVIQANGQHFDKPSVIILAEADGTPGDRTTVIDLSQQPDLKVASIENYVPDASAASAY